MFMKKPEPDLPPDRLVVLDEILSVRREVHEGPVIGGSLSMPWTLPKRRLARHSLTSPVVSELAGQSGCYRCGHVLAELDPTTGHVLDL